MSTLKIGTEIGSYVVVANPDPHGDGSQVLGQGAFGITYCGKQRGRLGRPVAIKEYFPNLLAHRNRDGSIATTNRSRREFEQGLKEFLEEAEALNRFDHPNIARVIDFVEAKGTAYIVMEWVAGRTLAQIVGSARRGTLKPMSIDTLRPILISLLGALDALHGAVPQLLHRDIKPTNVMIRDQDGSPVLIDFGAARQITAAASQRLTTILTDGYAPYEQYALSDEELEEEYGDLPGADTDSFPRQGAATDIYGLGAVCHFALTGKRPPNALKRKFGNVTYQPLESRIEGDPLFLRLIEKALAVEPEDRFASAREWRDALERGTEPPRRENPLLAPVAPPHPPGTVPEQPRARMWPLAVLAVLLLAAILLVVALNGRERKEANVADSGQNAIDAGSAANATLAVEPSNEIGNVGIADFNVSNGIDNAMVGIDNGSVGNTAGEPAFRQIRFNSLCRQPVSMIVRWRDASGIWQSGTWDFRASANSYFADRNDIRITTSHPEIYVYAWIPYADYVWEATADAPGIYHTYGGNRYGMRRMDLLAGTYGDYVLELDCDTYSGASSSTNAM